MTAQSVVERSPNVQGVWGLESGNLAFILAHRFEVLSGGDELFSVPTLTLAAGVPLGLTAGVDYTSFSEAIRGEITGNEAQFWLKRPLLLGGMETAGLVAYNTAAGSFDAAADVRLPTARVDVFAEARAHSSLFGSGEFGASGTLGGAFRLNRYIAVTGDYGRVLTEDTVPGTWSAALALELPASPHTLSLQVANGGATTLHGVARRKTVGQTDVRYGFAFTVDLGNRTRWERLFRPAPPVAAAPVSGGETVVLVESTFDSAELTIQAGVAVEWVNLDPVAHSVAAEDGSWASGRLEAGERFRRVFTDPGRYEYRCGPHPGMRGTIVVLPADTVTTSSQTVTTPW
ncbi:MAG: plastocyanin/azurin family copper-binding protein [Gemmatimonadota bacterium]